MSPSAEDIPSILSDRNIRDAFHFYVRCNFIRKFEDKLLHLFSLGKLSGTTHTGIGQEANAVGVAAACRATDVFISNHRCHAHVLAHTGLAAPLLREVMGDIDGYCGGLGGSQHICVKDRFYSNGIQGGILPLAAGVAFAKKKLGKDDLVCVFMGDGTTGEGAIYETLNLASLLKLPLLVIVEDNEIAQTTPTHKTISGSIRHRLEAFNCMVTETSFPTAGELFHLAQPVAERVRRGEPCAIIIKSARLGPHSKGDDTRPPDVIASMKDRDPLRRMAEQLKQDGKLEEANSLTDRLIATLAPCIEKVVEQAPVRMPRYTSLSLDRVPLMSATPSGMFIEKLNAGLRGLLENVPGTYMIGEDIGDPYGGAFKATKGLQASFPDRVIETPISELGFTGLAAGSAMASMRPIVEIMFGDFVLLALDQLVNHAAKYPLMYNGLVDCPLVIRLPMGGGRGYGPTHSQSLEKHLCGVPNLLVLAPSPFLPAEPFFDVMARTRNPVAVIENKLDYTRKMEAVRTTLETFDAEAFNNSIAYTPKGCTNPSLLIVTYGGQIATALEAAQNLRTDHNVVVSVLAVGQLHPFQIHDALAALQPQRVITLEEGSTSWGFGSEVAAILLEQKTCHAPAQMTRLGFADTIIPASRVLEKQLMPSADKVVETVLAMTGSAPTISAATLVEESRVHMSHSLVDGAVEIIALQLNANDDDLKVIEHLVADGAEVSLDQAVVTVETSKAAEEIDTPTAGFILFRCAIGELVKVGEVIAHVYPTRDALEGARTIPFNTKKSATAKVTSSPQAHATAVPSTNATPLTKVQKAMNRTLQISRDEIVPAYLLAECSLKKPASRKIELQDVVIHHAAQLLPTYTNCNACFDNQGLVHRKDVNFGFTADINGDLYIGVVRDTRAKTVEQIASERMDIILSLFRGEVDQSMLAEPTICLTSLNGKWFKHQIPVVYPRTALMIGFNQRPNEQNGIAASFTFAYDHRVVSGYEISKFADALIENILKAE